MFEAAIVLFCFADATDADTATLTPLTEAGFGPWRDAQPADIASHLAGIGFEAKAGQIAWLPGGAEVLVGAGDGTDPMVAGDLAHRLPERSFRLGNDAVDASDLALAWGLGAYRFRRYRKPTREPAKLIWPDGADRSMVTATLEATYLTRDLINTPTNDMGPAELAEAAVDLAEAFGASCEVIEGDALLASNYPLIHSVGRASVNAPRLIDLRWGDPSAPKVTLVGKGVCFDTGGLDLKSAANMLLMKKDMGGSAHVLGLARLIMATGLKVRLRVLVPAVENAVSGNAFRPSDILNSRKGLTVEIGNTDAEGRLVLADALTEASTEQPDLVIDFATLTGAARVALGTDVPALFVNDDGLADDFAKAAEAARDPLWRLPLWAPYNDLLKSDVADINNTGSAPFGGAITAALFLQRFVGDGIRWAHIDLMAWNRSAKPGHPKGGEAMGLRAAYRLIADRFAG
ncbi:MAG: leucyl aminopeptidase family protein [Pseudomonadota bacterium]